MGYYHHILLAADLNDNSEKVIRKTRKLVELYGADLTIAHAVEPIPAYANASCGEFESVIMDDARVALQKLGEVLEVPTERQQILMGPVKSCILTLAGELNVDLIIIGNHGSHGIFRLLASNIEGITHNAKCDVLTVNCF